MTGNGEAKKIELLHERGADIEEHDLSEIEYKSTVPNTIYRENEQLVKEAEANVSGKKE